MTKLDLTKHKTPFSKYNKLKRIVWQFVWFVFAKPLPKRMGNFWKLFLLKCFGAKIHKTSVVYSSVRIYMPWNLEMHEYTCLAPEVDCYNVDKVILKPHVIVSQKAYLCTASHDITKPNYPLVTAPVVIESQSWVGANAFIGMGVTIGEGAVVGATASVYKNVEPWHVVGGNPAKFIKKRVIK